MWSNSWLVIIIVVVVLLLANYVSFVSCALFLESKKEKKEKKEKTKKRDSKDLDVNSNDFSQENEEGGGSSPNTKSIFGVFRLSGRKSKSEKRGSKHGSSDSLKRLSVDSAEFERRASDVSFDESTTSTKVSTPSAEVVKESEIPKSQSNKPKEVKIVSAVHLVPVKAKEVGKQQKEKREDDVNEKLKEKSESLQEQAPVASEAQTFEFQLQSSVTLSETDKNEEGLEEHHRQEQVVTEKDQEIVTSEESSVNNVISNTRGMKADANKEAKNETQTKSDAEESVTSTKDEQGSQKQDGLQELPPIKEDAVMSVYKNKKEEETKGEKYAQDETIVLNSKEQTEDVVQSGITVHEELMTEAEPVVFIETKGGRTEDEQEQEAPVNDDAMELIFPDHKEDQDDQEIGNGPVVDKEEVQSLEISKKKENHFQEQVEELFKLDANVEEKSTPKAENMEKYEKEEKKSTSYSQRKFDERSEIVINETPPFDEKRSHFITSTPKRESNESVQGKTSEASKNKVPVTSYGMTQFTQTSVMEFNLKVQIVNNIKDAKISTKLLLAQLGEVNKKLHMLQEELLEVQKSDSNLDMEQ